MESSALVALVAGANTTVRGGEDAILDLTATVDPDEVGLMKCSRHMYIAPSIHVDEIFAPFVFSPFEQLAISSSRHSQVEIAFGAAR